MHTVVTRGYFLFLTKMMHYQFSFNSKNMLKDTSILKSILFNPIGGGEFQSLSKFFESCGIAHHLSCPHTHQQNGAVERKHCHIVETGLALLYHANIPLRFWDDAFQTACYLINRLPTTILKK